MTLFILTITTFNRLQYLKACLDSWGKTRSTDINWKLIIADDGSTDGTLEYLNAIKFENTEVIIIKNERIGVHQQMNTILKRLQNINFDFCFKIDDDITFLKSGWDELYYTTAMETGNHHLVFCDENWCTDQFLGSKALAKGLVGNVPMLHAHGFFYTLTPQVVEKVGYMDVDSFGFRGMGHVDYTMRCARAGFTNEVTPWDMLNSNAYISATKHDYKSVLPSTPIHAYDTYNRERKESIILQKGRIHIPFQDIDPNIYLKFKEELIEALSDKVVNFESDKYEIVSWHEQENKKMRNWYNSQYKHLPNWYIKLGKLFKLVK